MPSVKKPSTRRAQPSPYSYRISAVLVTIVVVVISSIVLTSYAQARRIPDNAGGPSAPTVTRIPSLGLSVPTSPIVEQGAVLDPPADPQRAGWWASGALPGSKEGSVVITAHKLHGGGGAFDTLAKVKRGALVTVDTQAGVQNYEVVSIANYDRDEFAEKADDLFRTDDTPRLVLITCYDWNGDDWNGNTVVIARSSA
ncbi:class F sortase [Granulicoccus sp. GXG6511]|uniref:class F sortase n=1 Tax=Granulicoccus sp. GXG6511 TaxID=3381351 RepID=UPI003D7D1B67